MNSGCLLCALSSSCSPLALADLHLTQLQERKCRCGGRVSVFGRGKRSMFQVIIHESSLQTIQINVCVFRPDGAYNLNRPHPNHIY